MDEQQGESPLSPNRATQNHEISPESEENESNTQLSLWPPEPQTPVPEPILSPGDSALPPPSPPPSPEPPWSLADLFAFVLFAVFSFLLANVLAVAVFSELRHRFFENISLEEALTATPSVVTMQTVWEILWLAFIYVTVSKKYQRRFWQALKWVRDPHPAVIYLAGGAGLAVGAQLTMNLFPTEKHLPIEKLFTSPESGYLLAVFGICVAPFVEELVFRGFFYPVFERLWGLAAAVILTALLFAAIHVPQLSGGWEEITAIFVVGLIFSYCRGKTRSLLPPFLMHLAYNAALFVSLYFSTDRFRNLKG